ncbi:hypothetical protein E2C01_078018 [Portunus trituberculatus]|uniref:Uncharacterized protein n=1 Tax=Portunus trituberculatus TaxID=210409 RepID=A0A5B7ICW5_PORTR|nr:hypothetical protein [Portunus trituberculatus]
MSGVICQVHSPPVALRCEASSLLKCTVSLLGKKSHLPRREASLSVDLIHLKRIYYKGVVVQTTFFVSFLLSLKENRKDNIWHHHSSCSHAPFRLLGTSGWGRGLGKFGTSRYKLAQ